VQSFGKIIVDFVDFERFFLMQDFGKKSRIRQENANIWEGNVEAMVPKK